MGGSGGGRSLLLEAAAQLRQKLAVGAPHASCVLVTPAYGLLAAAGDKEAVRRAVTAQLVLPWLEALAAGGALPGAAAGEGGGMTGALAAALVGGCEGGRHPEANAGAPLAAREAAARPPRQRAHHGDAPLADHLLAGAGSHIEVEL